MVLSTRRKEQVLIQFFIKLHEVCKLSGFSLHRHLADLTIKTTLRFTWWMLNALLFKDDTVCLTGKTFLFLWGIIYIFAENLEFHEKHT